MKYFVVFLLCFALASAYDRSSAVAYAEKWWNSANHQCSSSYDDCTPYSYWGGERCGYSSHGGDCANFVSQCLLAGNHPPLSGGYPCRGYPCGKEEVGANELALCLYQKHNWVNTCGKYQQPPSDIQVGDVLIVHEDSCTGNAHATIVTKISGGNIYVSAHSDSHLNIISTNWQSSHPYYQWLHYPK